MKKYVLIVRGEREVIIREKKWRGAYLGSLLAVVVLLATFLIVDIQAQAELIRTGTVINTDVLNFRKGPGTEYDKIGELIGGKTYTILDETIGSNSRTWYKINLNGVEGWASSSYMQVTETLTEIDKEFDAYLDEQGFPESYKTQLQVLHAKYPNWVFEAQQVDYDWDYVIEKESALGQNLVYYTSVASWKSTQDGAYDWETGTWKGFDGSTWVAASQEIIEYYMDPRNFLDSTYVFQFLKQSYDASALTKAELTAKKNELALVVEDTYLENKYTENGKSVAYTTTIMSVAKETGVDPLTLASMMIQEQGTKGTGKSISGTVSGYEGYYNYFNIGAYATSTMTAVQRGLWYASGSGKGATSYNRPWNTRTASILGGALYYGTNYVNAGQDTMYLKKYNVQGSNAFGHQYMTNVQGAASEGKHVADGYDETSRTAALVFKIPVYKNMPKTACEKPTSDADPNYMLKTLKVTGQKLSPSFNYDVKSYAVTVPYDVTSVKISATAVSDAAKVSGTGTKELEEGENVFSVKVTAENGKNRTYKLTITRLDASTAVILESSKYSVNTDKTITGITNYPIKATNFAKQFSVINGNSVVTDSDGAEKTENIGTGDQIRVYDTAGALMHTYDILIYGDTSGDGKVSSLDLLRVQKHILGISNLTGIDKTAADTSKDGKLSSLDLLQIQKQILGIKSIAQ